MKLHLISWLLIFPPKLKFQKGKKKRENKNPRHHLIQASRSKTPYSLNFMLIEHKLDLFCSTLKLFQDKKQNIMCVVSISNRHLSSDIKYFPKMSF